MSSCLESDSNSFLWSAASNDSSFSDNMLPVKLKSREKTSSFNHNNSDDEKEVKNELLHLCDETSSIGSSKRKKAKKKKIKQEPPDFAEPVDKKIKEEMLSDIETTKKKKKKSNKYVKEERPKIISDDFDDNDNEPADESYLQLRVKEEIFAKQNSVKIKKKKQCRNHDSTSGFIDNEVKDSKKKKKSKKKKNVSFTEQTHSESELDNNSENIKREPRSTNSDTDHSELSISRKNNKFKKKNNVEKNEPVIEDYFSAEETRVQSPIRNRHNSYSISCPSVNNDNSDNEKTQSKKSYPEEKVSHINGHYVSNGSDPQITQQTKSKSAKDNSVSRVLNGDIQHSESGSDSSGPYDRTKSQVDYAPIQDKHRRKSISDRIVFEDEVEYEYQQNKEVNNEISAHSSLSYPIKQYINARSNLQHVTATLPHNCIISDDDDVWLVKCPHEVTIHALRGVDFATESKSKVKVNEQTFEGSFEEEHKRLVVLSHENGQYVLKNIPLKGSLQFHRRIPKPHMMEDNMVVDQLTSFIPLPETKCRHPLFGAEYKRAVRLPRALVERLREPAPPSPIDPPQRRKRREQASPEQILKKHKKRKRKHTEAGEEEPHIKRIKHDPDSPAVWESEQAIEENLFNF